MTDDDHETTMRIWLGDQMTETLMKKWVKDERLSITEINRRSTDLLESITGRDFAL